MGLWAQLFGQPGVTSDETFSARAASSDPFRIPIVVAARQLVADTVSSFSMESVAATGQPTTVNAPITEQPNPNESAGDTFERIVNQMTRHGTAALRVMAWTTAQPRTPLAVEVIDWPRITYTLDATGAVITALAIDGRPTSRGDVVLIPFILDDGSPIGQSPLVQIYEALLSLNTAYQFAATYYSAGAVPPYALITPTRLAKGKAEDLLTSWATARENSRPAVLSGNLSLETFSPQSASDALVLDAINYFDLTVARVMQVPNSLLNAEAIGGSLSYSNSRDEFRRWLAIGLNTGYLHRIESAFTDMLPQGFSARFDTSSLTRLDETERAQLVRDNLAAGITDVTEARRALGLTERATVNGPRTTNA